MDVTAYGRISDDPTDTRLGVDRQIEDGHTVAHLRGWVITQERVDNDVSAFKVGVVRPAFEAMLDDLEHGRTQGVIAYDLDRLARQPVDLERLIRVYDARPGLVFATVQGDIDLQSADGRTMARVMVAFANKSSMDTGRRVKRKHLELARKGVPVGSRRPFGWKPGGVELDPFEAELVRQAVRDVMAGVSLHSISRRWNEAGVLTSSGNTWQKATVRQMLLSPRLAGWRCRYREIALDADGIQVRGQYAAIITPEEHEALCDVILHPDRIPANVHRGGRRAIRLLSGVARCGNDGCGMRMRGGKSSKGYHRYICPGCGRMSVHGPKADAAVEYVVLAHAADVTGGGSQVPWPRTAELDAVQAQVSELMGAYTAKRLSAAAVFPEVEKLEAEIATLNAERVTYNRAQMVDNARPPGTLAEQWPDLDVDQRRQVLSSLLSAVIVHPARSRGVPFSDERLEFVWRS